MNYSKQKHQGPLIEKLNSAVSHSHQLVYKNMVKPEFW